MFLDPSPISLPIFLLWTVHSINNSCSGRKHKWAEQWIALQARPGKERAFVPLAYMAPDFWSAMGQQYGCYSMIFMKKRDKGSRAIKIRDRLIDRVCSVLLSPSRQPCSIWCQALELPSWTGGEHGDGTLAVTEAIEPLNSTAESTWIYHNGW